MQLEYVTCDLCGSTDSIVRYRKPDNWLWLNMYEFPVVECINCGLVFLNPRPTFDEMGKYYPDNYHAGRDDELHLERYKNQFSYIKSCKAKKILDIGCARGDWLSFLGKTWPNAELVGVDAFSESVNNTNIHFIKEQLFNASLPTAEFDLITSWAVMEHVHTPSAYFQAVSNALSSSGKFIFLVTNSDSIYGKYAYKEDIPRHLYHFNESSLKQYAEKHGMILESISYDERFWNGTGRGMFRLALGRISGVTWLKMRDKNLNMFQKIMTFVGSSIDRVVFSIQWESWIRRSGIIVVVFGKNKND